jgi:hypothetical protein
MDWAAAAEVAVGVNKRKKNGMERTIQFNELQDRMRRYMPKWED